MRKTRPEHFLGPNGAGSVCACGCGRPINPTRSWHKFASAECRKKAWKTGKITAADFADIKKRLTAIEVRLGIVHD